MKICETICNLVHPRIPSMLSMNFVSGFVRKVICNFLGLVHLCRGKKDTAAVKISPTEQLVKLCDPPTQEIEGILIEPSNPAGGNLTVDPDPQTCGNVEKPKASDYTYYCQICNENCDHNTEKCPDRAGKFITVCKLCDFLPCKNEADHKEQYHYERFLFCNLCNTIGDHWIEMCPDIDSDMGDDWESDMDEDDYLGDFPENNRVTLHRD